MSWGYYTKPTTVTLRLAERSLAHPLGIVEDVLVKVGKFILPANFIVLDMEEDERIPIIRGCPFLATGRALIDIQKRELKLRVDKEEAISNVLSPIDIPACYMVEVVKEEEKPPQSFKQKVTSSLQTMSQKMRRKANRMLGKLRRKERAKKIRAGKRTVMKNAVVDPKSCKSDLKIS